MMKSFVFVVIEVFAFPIALSVREKVVSFLVERINFCPNWLQILWRKKFKKWTLTKQV